MIFLAIDAPTIIPADTPGWIVAVIVLAPVLTIVAGIWKVWYDRRAAKSDIKIAKLEAVRGETLRTEGTVTPVLADTPRIMYIGTEDKDKSSMMTAWQEAGMGNRLVTFDSPNAGFTYLQEHPHTVIVVIIYVEILQKGYEFLKLVKADNNTRDIPVIFIDGLGVEGKLKTYEMGGDGFLEKPIVMGAFLIILARLGYSSTVSKNK